MAGYIAYKYYSYLDYYFGAGLWGLSGAMVVTGCGQILLRRHNVSPHTAYVAGIISIVAGALMLVLIPLLFLGSLTIFYISLATGYVGRLILAPAVEFIYFAVFLRDAAYRT